MSRLSAFAIILALTVGFSVAASDGSCRQCSNDGYYCLAVATGDWGSSTCSGAWTDACALATRTEQTTCFMNNKMVTVGNLTQSCDGWQYMEAEWAPIPGACWEPCTRGLPHCHGTEHFNCTPGLTPGGDGSSPIMRNVKGAWTISSPTEGVLFDMHRNGSPEKWAWPIVGIGILVRDRDGGGITSGYDLYGDWTPDGSKNSNGFEWLRAEDNGDGIYDANDLSWALSGWWYDESPRDGKQQPHEIRTHQQEGVSGIGLDYHFSGRRDRHGNEFRFQAPIYFEDGRVEQVYDVFLQAQK